MEVEDEEVVDIATHVQSVICGSHREDAIIGVALFKVEVGNPRE